MPEADDERTLEMLTRDGILITEVDPLTAYVATADGMGYGPDATAYVPPTYTPTPPPTPEPTSAGYWLAAAEVARAAHHAVASAPVPISSGKSYDRSREAFIAAIHAAYPELDKFGVYGVWLDCMESVEYCARTFRSFSREYRRQFVAIGGGLS